MGLKDLTPQLRTRMNRVEWTVGLFVTGALLLLLVCFGYYVNYTIERKGLRKVKLPYYTLVSSAAGLKVGDPVRMMGFPAGEITGIEPTAATDIYSFGSYYQVYLFFRINESYVGYIWSDSEARIVSELLGNTYLEIVRGGTSGRPNVNATYRKTNNQYQFLDDDTQLNSTNPIYLPLTNEYKGYWVYWRETNSPMDRVKQIAATIQESLPGLLKLTNDARVTLSNTTVMMSNLNVTLGTLQPTLTNMALITGQIRDPHGSLGEWAIPTNINHQLSATLSSAHSTIDTTETNMVMLSSNLNKILVNLADTTSNLNAQVQANSLIVSEISSLIANTDDMIQGLKRHWALKSAFAQQTNLPPESIVEPTVGGKP